MIRLFILRLLENYFQHRWLYLLPIALTAIAGSVYLAYAKPSYTAESVLYVQEETFLTDLTQVRGGPAFSFTTVADTVAGEFSELLLTNSFMRAVVQQTDLEASLSDPTVEIDELLDELQKNVWVHRAGANLIAVNASDENPEIARQLSEAAIDTYINWKFVTESEENRTAQDFYATLLENYRADLDAANDQMFAYLIENPAPVRGDRPETEQLQISLLQSEIDLAEERLKNALDKDEDIRLAISQSESTIRQKYLTIDAPKLPHKPNLSRRNLALTVAAFLGAGMVLSLISLLGSLLLDRSFKLPVDVNYHLNLPVLAVVPAGKSATPPASV